MRKRNPPSKTHGVLVAKAESSSQSVVIQVRFGQRSQQKTPGNESKKKSDYDEELPPSFVRSQLVDVGESHVITESVHREAGQEMTRSVEYVGGVDSKESRVTKLET